MVNRLFVLHGDLGAAKNILKNIILLSPDVHFPVNTNDRLEYFLHQIYIKDSIDNWFAYEYRMKDYEKYGMKMILGDVDVDSILRMPLPLTKLLDKKNYALDLFNKERAKEVVDLPWVRFLMIYPTTDLGIRWQVRAYTTKKTPADLHNFSYLNQDLIPRHKETFGELSWIKVNTYNFYQNVVDYVWQLKKQPWPYVPLEWLLEKDKWLLLIDFLRTHFQIQLDTDKSIRLIQAWTDLHWPLNETDSWEHTDVFDNFRTDFSDNCIKNHSL